MPYLRLFSEARSWTLVIRPFTIPSRHVPAYNWMPREFGP